MLQLLPYLEQKTVARRFDDKLGVYAAANLTVRGAVISTFLCPSDGGPHRRNSDGVAMNNYAACHNDVEAPIDVNNKGVFFLNSHLRVGGRHRRHRQYDLRRRKAPPGNGPGLGFGNPRHAPEYRDRHQQDRGRRGRLLHRTKPAPIRAPDAGAAGKVLTQVGGFGSNHAGGANFAFGDGSVRFLKNSINPQVYRYLGNRADGEIVSGDQF